MPEGAVYVGRPTVWGNPWVVRWERLNGWVMLDPEWQHKPKRFYCSSAKVARRFAVRRFRQFLRGPFSNLLVKELRGRDLVCWCPLDQPCHADVLLKLANPTVPCPPAFVG